MNNEQNANNNAVHQPKWKCATTTRPVTTIAGVMTASKTTGHQDTSGKSTEKTSQQTKRQQASTNSEDSNRIATRGTKRNNDNKQSHDSK
jgi:hypothetical protein